MNYTEGTPNSERAVLRDRLAKLSPAQRDLIAQRLAQRGHSASSTPAQSTFPRVQPLRTYPAPTERDPGRKVCVFPAGPGQAQMWYHFRLEPNSAVYNSPFAFYLLGTLNVDALEAAFQALIARHATLRTVFGIENGELVQLVASSSDFRLVRHTLTRNAREDRMRTAESLACDLARRPFDLACEIPLRATLIGTGESEHLLLIELHHISSDGWSRSVLCRELSEFYCAQVEQRAPALEPLQIEFADHAAWRNGIKDKPETKAEVAYWETKLAGPLESIDLPTDRARSALPTFRGDACSIEMGTELWRQLKARAQEEEATVFMVLLAAFKILLHRYTGQADLRVGVPVANRHQQEVHGLIGLLINMLVLRTQIPSGSTFREVLNAVRKTTLDAYAHATLPFGTLGEHLRERTGQQLSALVPVLFTLQDFPEMSLQLPDIQARPWAVATGTAKVDLSIVVERSGEGWITKAEFSVDLFERGRIEKWLADWCSLLKWVLEHPDSLISEIPLAAATRAKLNDPQMFLKEDAGGSISLRPETQVAPAKRPLDATSPDRLIHKLIEEQSARSPDALAVWFEGGSLTYAELDEWANRVAATVQQWRVRPDHLIGLFVDRSPEMIAGILGILKAGAAYLPLDPAHPQDRIAFLLADAKPKGILTVSRLRSNLPLPNIPIAAIDALPAAPNRSSLAQPKRFSLSDSNLAYAIYTSGSTGKPNGVLIEHRSLTNYAKAAVTQFCLSPRDRVLQFAALSFDASAEEIFPCLASGATLVLRTDEMIARPAQFLECCDRWQLTVLDLPTAFWAQLLTQMEGHRLRFPDRIRLIIIGGERATAEAMAAWWRLPGHKPRLVNTYGPTESTIVATWCELTRPAAAKFQDPPIGQPVPNTTALVLDPDLRPVLRGTAGELFLGGMGVARGYLNRPDLTRKRFIRITLPDMAEQRFFRTGDKARVRADGQLEFLGRLDQQVKVRGHRVELGEVETVLSAHPDVLAAAVIVRQKETAQAHLAGCVVLRGSGKLEVGVLRTWLTSKLPSYMVPTCFAQVEHLPLTNNGKVDRAFLEVTTQLDWVRDRQYAAPRNELERVLTDIWQEALRQDEIGVDDDFFELGGHSLLAIGINARICEVLKVEVPLRWIFEQPTVRALATQIESLKAGQHSSLSIADRTQPLPLSFGQEQMWLLQQMIPDPAAYNIPYATRLGGPVDRCRVRRSLETLLEKHEILRTALVHREGRLVQQIIPASAVSLPWQEMSLDSSDQQDRSTTIRDRITEEVRHPFDLARAPLWRVLWLETAANEQVLVFTFHHSVMDEWALRLFLDEWAQIYADTEPSTKDVAPRPQYADYAMWWHQHFTPESLAGPRDFWRKEFAELPPPLELPSDRRRPSQPSGRGAARSVGITPTVMSQLRDLARAEEASLYCLLLTAFQVFLFRYTGQTDLSVGTPVTRRERPELQTMLGYFLNTVPVRAQLDARQSFRLTLARVRQVLSEVIQNSDLPFSQIVQLSLQEREREAGAPGLYRAMFVFSEESAATILLGTVKGERLPVSTQTSKNDLTVSVRQNERGWECRFEYAIDLFDSETVARMAENFVELLGSIGAAPDEAIGRLNLLCPNERRLLLSEWTRTQQSFSNEPCVQSLFEKQAGQTPQARAVEFGEESLTYDQLNSRANQLAKELCSRGIGPDMPVGICLERKPDMIVAVLAILKAGGACLPLETTLPPQRLGYILQDCGCQLIVTEQLQLPIFTELSAATDSAIAFLTLDKVLGAVSETEPNPPLRNHPNDIVYILYTSGSTGYPKGVEMPHRALLNLVQWQALSSKVESGNRTLQFASLGFDVAFQEIFSTLTTGGTLVLVSEETRRDPAMLLNVLARCEVERVFLPIVMLERLAQVKLDTIPKKLREVIVAGEQLRISPAIRSFFIQIPGCRLWNHYGPTESHVVTACELDEQPQSWPELPPIGQPIANCQVYVLDAELNPAPVGVYGELFITGVCLARGYRGRPDLTAERFLRGLDLGLPDQVFYRTGDICRWRADGQLEFSARSDHQVKIRGHRVELGEIEATLRAVAGVREAAVILRDEPGTEKCLVAYVAMDPSQSPDAEGLNRALRETLPDYMVPGLLQFMPALPLNANGKVDRGALPRPEPKPQLRQPLVQPRNRVELELRRIWERLFQRKDIGCQDNFFALGGHSLLAAELTAEIERTIGCKLAVATLFQAPTIEALAERLTRSDWKPRWSSLVPLQPLGEKTPLYFAHGWGGDVYGFVGLARLLEPDQPAYGFQAVGLNGEGPRHTTIEAMAEHYIREMRSFQPEGPYHLAGYSMGGLIALEIAQQLWAQGQKVGLLALLDTPPKSAPWTVYARSITPYFIGRWRLHWDRWRHLPMPEKFFYVKGLWRKLTWWLAKNQKRSAVVTEAPQPATEPVKIPLYEDYYWAVAVAYRLRRYPGAIDLFVTDSLNPALAPIWSNLARGGAVLHRFDCRHLEIMAPDHLPKVAEHLRAALERIAQQRPTGNQQLH